MLLQNLKWSELKAFADDKINVSEKTEICFGKGRKQQCFQKVSYKGSLKIVIVW